MRHYEFATTLVEAASPIATTLTKPTVVAALAKIGYEEIKDKASNKIEVLVQIPDGQRKDEFRNQILGEILASLQKTLKEYQPTYSDNPKLSSLGGIIFQNSPVSIVIKDSGGQGEKSAGVANELEMASILQSVVDKYGSANVTFQDPRGKKMSIKNCTNVDVAGRDTANRKKADVVLRSQKGALPISIKKVNADMWESADSLFGEKAKDIIQKLVKQGAVKLIKISETTDKKTGATNPVYKLDKEIVVEPTPEEGLAAIFGSDLNPKGGVVIQTFKPQHFVQEGNNVTIACHAVITSKEDIPESHLMVWLIRNDSTRSNPLPGLRTLGVTLARGIGKKGDKDVVLVDVNGNVTSNPNAKQKVSKEVKPEVEPEVGSEFATRAKR
jgi:hypothetical protein